MSSDEEDVVRPGQLWSWSPVHPAHEPHQPWLPWLVIVLSVVDGHDDDDDDARVCTFVRLDTMARDTCDARCAGWRTDGWEQIA